MKVVKNMSIVATSNLKNEMHLEFIERELAKKDRKLIFFLNYDGVEPFTLENLIKLQEKYKERVIILVSNNSLIKMYDYFSTETHDGREMNDLLVDHFSEEVVDELLNLYEEGDPRAQLYCNVFMNVEYHFHEIKFFQYAETCEELLGKFMAIMGRDSSFVDTCRKMFTLPLKIAHVEDNILYCAQSGEELNIKVTNKKLAGILKRPRSQDLADFDEFLDEVPDYKLIVSATESILDFGTFDDGNVRIAVPKRVYQQDVYKNVVDSEPICMYDSEADNIIGINSIGLNYAHKSEEKWRRKKGFTTMTISGCKYLFKMKSEEDEEKDPVITVERI